MRLYNKAMEELGLRVIVDREAYPEMFAGPNGPIIRNMQGTVIQLAESEPGKYGAVKVKFTDLDRIKRLKWESDEQWFLTGALSWVGE